MPEKVAVIGAGPLGLVSLKTFKEDGFDVTAFETRPYVGGLWKYSEDSSLSVATTTIFNSSRYRSAWSDFPFPTTTDDFPTWQQMYQYLNDYCDHFDLRQHIHLSTRVTGLFREGDKWIVEATLDGASPQRHSFDRVLVASGSFVKPKIPQFPGIEKFEGTTVHAIDFKHPENYKNKKVLIVGVHATSQDIATSLDGHASKLYLSQRHGAILVCKPPLPSTSPSS